MNIRTVHLFVFDTMADWEAADAVTDAHNLKFPAEAGRYRVVKAAAKLAPVTTMAGTRIRPDVTLAGIGIDSSALLVLPGGRGWESGGNDEALQLAARFIASGVPVATICGATLALSRTGVFDRLRDTGLAREYLISSGYRGTAFYCGTPAVKDGGIVAEPGLSPVDFARQIFSTLNLNSHKPEAHKPDSPHADSQSGHSPDRRAPHPILMQCDALKFSALTVQ